MQQDLTKHFPKKNRRSSSDRETRKQQVRKELEKRGKKKGFMTPERKKKLRVIICYCMYSIEK